MREPMVALKDEAGNERLVPLSQVEIPDLWGAYESLCKAAEWLQTDMMNPTKNHLISERAKCIDAIATKLLASWNLMHAMKKAQVKAATGSVNEDYEKVLDTMVEKERDAEERRSKRKVARKVALKKASKR